MNKVDTLEEISKIFSGDPNSFQNASQLVRQALLIPETQLRCLQIVQNMTIQKDKNAQLFQFLNNSKIFDLLFKFIFEESVNLSEISVSIFLNASIYALEILDVYLPMFLKMVHELAKTDTNGIGRLRILYLFAGISTKSTLAFEKLQSYNCLDEFITAFDIDDVLEALNVIEVFQIIGSTVHGMEFIIQSGIGQKLLDIVQSKEDGTGGLLIEKCLVFISTVARNKATHLILLTKLPVIISLQACLENEDLDIKNAITTVGAVGSSELGITSLFESAEILKCLFSNMHHGQEMKICVLNSFKEIIERKDPSPNEIILVEKLCYLLSQEVEQNLLLYLLQQMKSPYIEMRISAYSIIHSLVLYRFGIENFVKTAGLLEYLLTRDREIDLEGCNWKFIIFQRLVEFPDAKELLGIIAYRDCIEYLKHGITWVNSKSQVAIDDSTK